MEPYLRFKHIVCIEEDAGRIFKGFDSITELVDEYTRIKGRKHWYEIVRGNQRPYFDIDGDDDFVPNFKALRSALLGKEFSVYNSSPGSYHIVINDYFVKDHERNSVFCKSIISSLPDKQFYDTGVYTSIRQMRMLGSSKCGKVHIKHIEGSKTTYESIVNSLITNCDDCELINVKMPIKIKEQYDVDQEKIDMVRSLIHVEWPNCFEIREIKGNMILLNRLRSTHCRKCDRYHENEHPYIIVKQTGFLFFCRRNEEADEFPFDNEGDVFFVTVREESLFERLKNVELDLETVEYRKLILDCNA